MFGKLARDEPDRIPRLSMSDSVFGNGLFVNGCQENKTVAIELRAFVREHAHVTLGCLAIVH